MHRGKYYPILLRSAPNQNLYLQ